MNISIGMNWFWIGNTYKDFIDSGDPRVTSWPLMGSPLVVSLLTALYLCVVSVGPRLMDNRAAYDLKKSMLVYNLCLVLLSAYMVYEFFVSILQSGHKILCQPVDFSDDPVARNFARMCWIYLCSKIIEFLDTVFFILRKKNGQISFLHVYHHASVPFVVWIGTRYSPGGNAVVHAMLNSFVHVVMYSYYGLSALGPSVHKYLWWKKYLTSLQLVQFVLLLLLTGYDMLADDCPVQRGYTYLVFLHFFSFLVLFSNFYIKTYSKEKRLKGE